jgi:hypothetical protein
MAGLDSPELKIIQLECIIASKDKEINLLREQLSQDQEVGTSGGRRSQHAADPVRFCSRSLVACCLLHIHHTITLNSE